MIECINSNLTGIDHKGIIMKRNFDLINHTIDLLD